MEDFGVALQRYLLAALAGLVAIVFWSGLSDPTSLPKMTITAVIAVVLVGLSLVRLIVSRRLVLPNGPVVWATLALFFGCLLATVLSDVPAASVPGVLGRADGLLLYASCLVCFFVALRVYDAHTARWVPVGILVGGLFLASYGLFQWAGIDPVNWADIGLSPIIGTLGNPDFEAAYVGIVLPLAAWGALTRSWGTPYRIASVVVFLLSAAVAVVASSSQGLLAGAAGLGVLAVSLLLARDDAWRTWGLLALAGLGGLFAAVVLVGLVTGAGPGDRVVSAGSLTARKWYWNTAVDMWREHPLTGVGLDRYGAYYRAFRLDDAAAVSNYSDAAHSVPLHLLATGGLVVAVPYVTVVVLVLVALVRGLRALDGETRLLLGGIGGAWLAYQVQSLVSIDEPALAVTAWLLAPLVVLLGWPPRQVVRMLPGANIVQPRGRRAASLPAQHLPNWSPVSIVLTSGLALSGIVAVWWVTGPLRADRSARLAAVALAEGRGNDALAHFDDATARSPHSASYWLRRGKFLEQVKQLPMAKESYESGLRHDPRSYDVLIAAAQLAKVQGDSAALDRYAAELHRVDPSDGWRPGLDG